MVSKRLTAEGGISCYPNTRKKTTGVFVVYLLFASVLLVNLAVGMPSNVGFSYLFICKVVCSRCLEL